MIIYLFSILTYLSFFFSTVNIEFSTISIITAVISIGLGFKYISTNKKIIKFPKYFELILTFTIVQAIYILFVGSKTIPLQFTLVFVVSLLYWLIFYNLKNASFILKRIILYLSLTYFIIYIASQYFDSQIINFSKQLFLEVSSRHYHFGDLWAIALTILVVSQLRKFNVASISMSLIGVLSLVISNSRSAYLSLIVGCIYIYYRLNTKLKVSMVIATSILISTFFVYSSLGRTTILSRPYFIQSLIFFIDQPFGIGMGNFSHISNIYYLESGDLSKFSLHAHNIFLEALSGVGVFSIFFYIFIFNSVKDILKTRSPSITWGAVFLSITTNFMFDSTYMIHGFVWLWFMSLGIFQQTKAIQKI